MSDLAGNIRQQFHELLRNRRICVYPDGVEGGQPVSQGDLLAVVNVLIDAVAQEVEIAVSEPRKPFQEASSEDLDEIVRAHNWDNHWPSEKPKPVEFADDGAVLWKTKEGLSPYLWTRDESFRDKLFIAAFREPGLIACERGKVMFRDTSAGVFNGILFDGKGIPGVNGRAYPYGGVVYEQFARCRSVEGEVVYYRARGSFNHWPNDWVDPEVLEKARAVLRRCPAEFGPGVSSVGTTEGPRGPVLKDGFLHFREEDIKSVIMAAVVEKFPGLTDRIKSGVMYLDRDGNSFVGPQAKVYLKDE